MENRELIKLAINAKNNSSYTPYSSYKVGAAVEMEDGSVYTGGNIEIVSYSPTNCAERTAIFKAVSEGKRNIKKIAVVGDKENTFPCGVCRQVIREFGENPDIIVANSPEDYSVYKLEELLPHSFGPEYLIGGKDEI
ncbi:cytidine deaminase [Anaerosphaera aminiphila DSM 21120]|uniref:Cytidine deaminase n=1 Tax=Anaerosphaera aminiphila DSM 21120 TaxID=1120995 RepID=A0A1M5RJ57_9FIRM|nr:cytidine deaminase [Anaerosphaera aminiphila]SHH26305.1 cytidine deaminase [Anaerosphaera aminiphila DSM 21120]